MRVLITRPRPAADKLAGLLAARGIDGVIEPPLDIHPRDGAAIDLDGVQALLFTSANGVAAFAAASPRRDLPALTVGPASAEAARAAGFAEIASADGDVGALAQLVGRRLDPKRGALLHAAGADLAGDLAASLAPRGFVVRRVVLYDAVPARDLSAETVALLRRRGLAAALFFSPRTASAFVTLVRRAGLAETLTGVTALCLSPNVAAALDAVSWAGIHTAARPDQDALLELLAQRMTMATPDRGHKDQIIDADAEPVAARPPGKTRRRGGGWPVLLVIVLAVAAAAYLYGPRIASRIQATTDMVTMTPAAPDTTRLDALEREVAALAARPAVPSVSPEQLAALAERIAGLERQLAERNREDPGLAAKVTGLERSLADLAELREQGVAQLNAVALMLSAAQLRDVALRGRPFAAELESVRKLGPDLPAVRALAPLASGAPTPAMLTASFAALPARLIAAGDAPADDIWSRVKHWARRLVTVRPVGETPGSAPGAIAARAELRLAAGDVDAALAEVKQLSGPAAEAAAEWRAAVERRLALERALTALDGAVVARLRDIARP